jgi:hypothetical protein
MIKYLLMHFYSFSAAAIAVLRGLCLRGRLLTLFGDRNPMPLRDLCGVAHRRSETSPRGDFLWISKMRSVEGHLVGFLLLGKGF